MLIALCPQRAISGEKFKRKLQAVADCVSIHETQSNCVAAKSTVNKQKKKKKKKCKNSKMKKRKQHFWTIRRYQKKILTHVHREVFFFFNVYDIFVAPQQFQNKLKERQRALAKMIGVWRKCRISAVKSLRSESYKAAATIREFKLQMIIIQLAHIYTHIKHIQIVKQRILQPHESVCAHVYITLTSLKKQTTNLTKLNIL